MVKGISEGCKIYADTNMIAVAVKRLLLKEFDCEIVNYVHDADVYAEAEAKVSQDLWLPLRKLSLMHLYRFIS